MIKIWRANDGSVRIESGENCVELRGEDVVNLLAELRPSTAIRHYTNWTPAMKTELRRLYLIEHLPASKIAEILGVSVWAVKKQIARNNYGRKSK